MAENKKYKKYVRYERNLTGSYVITDARGQSFDEKILLKKKIPGFLKVKKCFVDGQGQYWYNITGKQSLDTICSIRMMDYPFIEKIIIQICTAIETLEKNLISPDCLMLDPEMIFIDNQSREFLFIAEAGGEECLADSFRELMEYLLTKIDHGDQRAVKEAYDLYQITLDEGYSLMDLRRGILRRNCLPAEAETKEYRAGEDRPEESSERESDREEDDIWMEEYDENEKEDSGWWHRRKKKKRESLTLGQKIVAAWVSFWDKSEKELEEEDDFYIRYDESKEETNQAELEYNPTVCLLNASYRPEGILLYEGMEEYQSIYLKENSMVIGQGRDVDVSLVRNTISHIHAKIIKEADEFFIEDMNSTNGTYLNGLPLAYHERKKLKANDIVRFADLKFRFV